MALERGASPRDDGGGVRFAVWAPRARRVSVRVVAGGRTGEWPLPREGDVFVGMVEDLAPGADYVYRVEREDGAWERPDPVSRFQPHGVHGPSRVVDPRAFRWSDRGWRAPHLADLVFYELHVGTFTDAGTFDGAIAELPALR